MNIERLMGIDSSSKSIAFSVLSKQDGLVDYGKRELVDSEYGRIGHAITVTDELLFQYDIDTLCVEDAPYINNKAVFKLLAMVQGCIIGVGVRADKQIITVPPITWQTYIGNGRFTKEEKQDLKDENPDASDYKIKKMKRQIKKQRTIDFANELGVETDDDDIADSAGVAWYGIDGGWKDD